MNPSRMGYYGVFAEEHWKRKQFHQDLGFFPKQREAASLVIDGNSIIRNSVNTVGSVSRLPAAASVFVGGSSVLGGTLGVPIGLSAIRDSMIKGKAAYDNGDTSGAFQNALWGMAGAGYAGLSSVLVTDGVMSLSGVPFSATLVPAFSGLGLMMSGAILAHSGYGLSETTQFKHALKKAREKGGERGALEFLNGEISLSPKEIADKSDSEIGKALQKKWGALERKVGVICASKIRESVPSLLQSFNLEKIRNFLFEVDKANFKERIKYGILFAIGLIGAFAFFGLLLTTGPFSPILFVIGAALWLLVDSSKLHDFVGEKCWAWHCRGKTDELFCQTFAS